MGMLAHGCVGEPIHFVSDSTCMKYSDMDCLDMMTSKTSTFPYDDDKMQKMITLVEKAKGKSLFRRMG